jgi:hypothetical protein
VSGSAQPVIVEGLDPVLIIRLFPEAAGITDGETQALAQGVATMEAGALLVASQYEPIPGVGGDTPPAATAPVNTAIPAVTQSGITLTCTQGTWTGEPTGYAYAWQMDGVPIGSGAATYDTIPADVGQTATCIVTATNATGSTAAPPSVGVIVI